MKIKLGNDINFTWNVYRDGEPEDWTGKVIEVKLLSPHKTECAITNIDHSTQGVITFTYLGMNQTIYGDYTAVLYENNGDEGMVAVDAVKAVTLVRHSYQTSAVQDSTIITDSVILEGSITVIPSTPSTQVQANWEETDTTSPAYILHKPDLTVFVTNTALTTTLADYVTNTALATVLADYVTNATLATALTNYVTHSEFATALADYATQAWVEDKGYLTEHQDISGKENVTSIVEVASGTTAITAEVNKYYEVAGEVGALTITLPTPTDLTKVAMVVIHLLAGTTPNVVIGSTETIDYSAAYDISASKEYEINCLFNGDKWVVADMEVV